MMNVCKPAALLAVVLSSASAEEPDFYRDVYPFLKANCISCHNKTTTKAGLNMETPALMKAGGDTGPSIIPGDSEGSLIVEASIHSPDFEMPPPNNKSDARNLTPAEIEILRNWINLGAKDSVREERQVTWKSLAPGVHPIHTLAMSENGRYATCARGNEIFIYDLATQQLVSRIPDAHRGRVTSLAFSPDSQWIATGGYREVKLWKQESKAAPPVTKLPAVETVAQIIDRVPADFEQVNITTERAAILTEEQVSLWDLKTGEPMFVAKSPPLMALSIHEDSIVTLDVEKKVRLITKDGSKPLCELAYPAAAIALSPDGKRLATGDAAGIVRTWEVATGKEITRYLSNTIAHGKASDLEWKIARETLEAAVQKSEVTALAAKNKALDDLIKKANDAIAAMQKSLPKKEEAIKPAKEATLAARNVVDEAKAAYDSAPDDSTLKKAWIDAKDKLITAQSKENSAVTTFESTKNNIADDEVKVAEMTASKADNDQLSKTAKAAEKAATETSTQLKAELAEVKKASSHIGSRTITIGFSADASKVIGTFEDGSRHLWASETGRPITDSVDSRWTLTHTISEGFTDRVNALAFSPNGRTLATGGGEASRSGDIHFFEVATGKQSGEWLERHSDSVLSLDYSPDGKLLASGAADKIAHLTEMSSGEPTKLFEAHTHYVMDIAFRADGRVVATAGADGVVNTWDVALGERIKKIEGWNKEVTSLEFIGATNQIVTSAGDNLIRIVRDDGGQVRSINKLPDFMQATASTPDGKTIIGGGEDSFLRIWNGTDGKEIIAFAP